MICMRRRSWRSSRNGKPMISRPSNFTLPEVGSIRRRIQRPVVVLPQPLSPTSPSTSPSCTANDTPSTARTWPTVRESSPFLIGKCFLRSVTSRMIGVSGVMWRRRPAAEPDPGYLRQSHARASSARGEPTSHRRSRRFGGPGRRRSLRAGDPSGTSRS